MSGSDLAGDPEAEPYYPAGLFCGAAAVGVVAALFLVVLAGPAAWLLDEPLLEPVLEALAPILVLFAASGIYQAKLRRELLLRGFAFASVLASLSGGVVAVTMAWWWMSHLNAR